MVRRRFEVPDDSGFLALVDPDVYQGFVDSDWTYDSLFLHFRDAMMQQSLLLWGTGREDMWTVDVVTDGSQRPAGYRRVTGPIRVSTGRLLLTNYESLTMAAQFPDVRLPEPHLQDLVVEVPTGQYVTDIVQLHDPDEYASDAKPDFLIALSFGNGAEEWREPPWHDT